MTNIFSILSSNYLTVGNATGRSNSKYVAVDPAKYEGKWNGKYANGQSFSVSVTNVDGFHAKVKYQSASTLKYQDVLIRDSAFRIGDSKFFLTGDAKAMIKTVVTNPATGASTLETAYAALEGATPAS